MIAFKCKLYILLQQIANGFHSTLYKHYMNHAQVDLLIDIHSKFYAQQGSGEVGAVISFKHIPSTYNADLGTHIAFIEDCGPDHNIRMAI